MKDQAKEPQAWGGKSPDKIDENENKNEWVGILKKKVLQRTKK